MINLRCVMCGRVTLKPAVTLPQGVVGPTCASQRDLLPIKGKPYSIPKKRFKSPLNNQDGLFDEDTDTEDEALQGLP